MEQTSVQKLARVLRVMVVIVFVCNIFALILVPIVYHLSPLSNLAERVAESPVDDDMIRIPFLIWFFCAWAVAFQEAGGIVFVLFFWFCGVCTAAILWQAKLVLDTILNGEPFSLKNAANLKRAAMCCFLISGAALVRLIWGLSYYGNAGPLVSYNTLFVPIFLMAGLVCMVMSALFRQAAELKAENDLTI